MTDAPDKTSIRPLEIATRTLLCPGNLSPLEGGRSENQDNYLVIEADGGFRHLEDQQEIRGMVEGWPAGHRRVAVMDGMGGHSFGRQVAEATARGLLTLPAASELAHLEAQLEGLHRHLYQEYTDKGGQPGCTLTLVEIPPSGPALLFHAGDSRLYGIGPEGAHWLTVDHVPATKFAMHLAIDREEWLRQVHHQPGSQLSQAFVLGNTLGSVRLLATRIDPALVALHDGNLPAFLKGLGDRRPLELQPQRVYLLASDGLWRLEDPLDFIDQWPRLLLQPRPLE
ncbi:MAG: protein phosphatase, partial [Candidatus Competibacteraceae bacterium]|nr:protein phosphatase [Candidatus Competibacteraceae bacterium]